MELLEFLTPAGELSAQEGPEDHVVLSSRVRLARNLADVTFPGRAKKANRVETCELILPRVSATSAMRGGYSVPMGDLKALDKQLLVERHLISREHAAKGTGSAIVLNKGETLSVMVNEEDHLRMQALLPGMQIKQVWQKIDRFDTSLEKKLEYAFDANLGYLTACPTNLGTGIRVSAMLHLPGLVLIDQVNQIIQAVTKLGHAVRGLYGEGTEALGHIFQVSNQMTLGESEGEIIQRIHKVVMQIIEHEENARQTLLKGRRKELYNHIGRAYGVLAHAHIVDSKHSMNQLSLMRLGVKLGLFEKLDAPMLGKLFLLSQPAHLQQFVGKKMTGEERDIHRSDLLRGHLSKVKGLNIPNS
jgi:protein arginine kinase|tara:strand:+ start:510 stop:1586 length:1077 start_codon:yes stop_codon:yes gene_type:complete